jgi:hypothetical protein
MSNAQINTTTKEPLPPPPTSLAQQASFLFDRVWNKLKSEFRKISCSSRGNNAALKEWQESMKNYKASVENAKKRDEHYNRAMQNWKKTQTNPRPNSDPTKPTAFNKIKKKIIRWTGRNKNAGTWKNYFQGKKQPPTTTLAPTTTTLAPTTTTLAPTTTTLAPTTTTLALTTNSSQPPRPKNKYPMPTNREAALSILKLPLNTKNESKIKKAYFELAKKIHPNKVKDPSQIPDATEAFQQLGAAKNKALESI